MQVTTNFVAEGVLSHTLTFNCVGQCSWESFESSQRCFGGAMHRREPSAALTICSRAVAASEPDVLVTHLAIERAGDYDLISCPVVHDGLVRLQAPCHGHVECVFRVLLHVSLSAELLVSQGWAPTACYCTSTLHCRTTTVSSERLCV